MDKMYRGGGVLKSSKISLNSVVFGLMLLGVLIGITLAFLFNSDFASGFLGISGKVEIIAVGKGDEYNSIENGVSSSNLVIELDKGYKVLIPGMPLRMDVNCKVKRSTTKPLLRAWLSLDLYDVDTMEKIDDWGEDAGVIIDINNQLDSVITCNSKWVLHNDGFYYYVTSIDDANVGDSILQEIDATAGDVIIPFIDKEIKFPTFVDSTYSGFGVKIRVTFQAIQNYIPDDNGQKLPNTIDNSYKIFNGFGSMYESTPISMFDTVENADGTISIKAKKGVTYPNTLYLPTHTADGKLITSIAGGAFDSNKNITYVYIPYSYTKMGSSAFSNSSVITVDASDSSLENLGYFSFSNSQLTSIKLPNTLKTIADRAFRDCKNLVSLKIPASVTNINPRFATSCPNFRTITVDEGNANYYDIDEHSLVSKDGLLLFVTPGYSSYEYTLDDRITQIEASAFYYVYNVTTLNLSKNFNNTLVFNQNCGENIAYINLNENPNFSYLTDAYDNKYLIKNSAPTVMILCTLSQSSINVSAPESLLTCNGYTLFRPASLIANYRYIGIGNLSNVTDSNNLSFNNVISYEVATTNTGYQTISGLELLTKDGKKMIRYAKLNPATTYTVPDIVETIGDGTFNGAHNIITLSMSSNVKTIEGWGGITTMDKVVNLTLSGVIGDRIGMYMRKIKHVTLLDTVTSIGQWFFCSGSGTLEWIEFQAITVPTINSVRFMDSVTNKSSFVIYVPDASVDAYKSATAFANFVDRIKPVSERPAS